MILSLILIVGLANCFSVKTTPYIVTELNNDWSMNIIDGPPESIAQLKSKIYKTSIPTTVHLDLLTAKDIPDPFLK